MGPRQKRQRKDGLREQLREIVPSTSMYSGCGNESPLVRIVRVGVCERANTTSPSFLVFLSSLRFSFCPLYPPLPFSFIIHPHLYSHFIPSPCFLPAFHIHSSFTNNSLIESFTPHPTIVNLALSAPVHPDNNLPSHAVFPCNTYIQWSDPNHCCPNAFPLDTSSTTIFSGPFGVANRRMLLVLAINFFVLCPLPHCHLFVWCAFFLSSPSLLSGGPIYHHFTIVQECTN